ncbi:hypothetical protein CRUP_021380 [Coryphaenoides rupestris]|nr:hypothetical protein CRUP_021380 [Coryphaenoides rupestris]
MEGEGLTKQHNECYVDDKVSKVAWLNRSNIIFAGQDKWSLDPRVDLVTKGQLEYSLRIQKVDVYDEGAYTCSISDQAAAQDIAGLPHRSEALMRLHPMPLIAVSGYAVRLCARSGSTER